MAGLCFCAFDCCCSRCCVSATAAASDVISNSFLCVQCLFAAYYVEAFERYTVVVSRVSENIAAISMLHSTRSSTSTTQISR